MKIALISCPLWLTETPPYNMALIAAVLQAKGDEAFCFDLNIDLYSQYKEIFKDGAWPGDDKDFLWTSEAYIRTLFNKAKTFIDNYIDRILNTGAGVICFTIYRISLCFSLELARRIKVRCPDKIIIFGGPQCFRHNLTVLYSFENSPVDAICVGESEICFPDLIEIIDRKGYVDFCEGFFYRNGRGDVIDCGDAPFVDDLGQLPFADFSHFDLSLYDKKCLPIATSRGCINRCTFCNESVFWRKFRVRSSHNIFDEISYQLNLYPKIKEFFFNDSLINGDIDILDGLADLIIDAGIDIIWGGQCLIRKEMTPEFLDKLKHAGCRGISYGIESGSDKVLKLMNKHYDHSLAERVLRNTCEAGIGVSSFNIIVGFPGETEKEFQETVDFLKTNQRYADRVNLNFLNVLPYTPLDKDKEKWGIVFSHEVYEPHIFWQTEDGLNNHEERIRRLNICRDVLEGKEEISSEMSKQLQSSQKIKEKDE